MAEPLTDSERRRTEGLLREQLRKDDDEAVSLGYIPKQFRIMLAESGPVEACRRVIMAPKIPDGFLSLLERDALHLTAEATVLRGPWCVLFEDAVLEQARKRLWQYNRADLALTDSPPPAKR